MKKILLNSVFTRVEVLWFQIFGATYKRSFCPWLVFHKQQFNLSKDALIAVLLWPDCLSTSFIYARLELLKYLTVIDRIHCSGKSFMALHKKPYFLFPNVLKRWSFQENCTGIWSLLYYQETLYFFFPRISSYSLDGKWKMIFLKKIHGNMILSSNVLKR